MLENQVATDEVLSLDAEEAVVEKSMDDTIRDTLRGLQDKGAVLEEEAPLDDVEKANNIRDDKGKFAKNELNSIVDPNATPIEEQVSNAPNTWKKDAQGEWAKLSPNVRAEVERREADFHKGIEQYKTKANTADNYERAIAPYMATINRFNVAPEVAVSELLRSDDILRNGSANEKMRMFGTIIRDYGIDPNDIFNYLQNGTPQEDPRDQRLYALESTLANQQRMVQEKEESSLNNEINSFANEPSHTHFESVKGHMAALLQAGQAQNLKDAYDQAIYANPTTRALVIAEQQTKSKAEATQKAQSAKAAASVNVTRRQALPATAPIGSMDETIRATLRRLQGS